MRRIEYLTAVDDFKGADASFEQLAEAIREAADWDERKAENLLTEKVVTEFVNFLVEKAEKESVTKRLKGGTTLKINKGIKLGNIHDHDAELPEKRRKVPDKSPSKSHVNSFPKKRLQELLGRDDSKEEEADKLNKQARMDGKKQSSHSR